VKAAKTNAPINVPPMPGVFPDYPAPVVRNMMRWGLPPPPKFGGRISATPVHPLAGLAERKADGAPNLRNYRRPRQLANRTFGGLEPMNFTRNRLNRCIAGAVSLLVLTSLAILGVARVFVA
jgi:hypothetical protein